METVNNKFVTNFILLLLVAVFAWLLGKFAWSFFYAEQQELIVPDIQAPSQQSAQVSGVAAPIYLFGRAENASAPVLVAPESVKKTRLNLKLLGVLVMPDNGVAIIQKGTESNSYTIEETIQRGVVLKEVHPSYVVLSHNGILEKLQMVENENVFTEDASSEPLTAKQKQTLDNVKQNALKNPISIMRYVRFQMVQKGGNITAVKVWPQKEVEIFKALGFEAGDELQVVNGHSVADLTKSPDLWQELLKKSYLDLTVKRQGKVQNISVQLN